MGTKQCWATYWVFFAVEEQSEAVLAQKHMAVEKIMGREFHWRQSSIGNKGRHSLEQTRYKCVDCVLSKAGGGGVWGQAAAWVVGWRGGGPATTPHRVVGAAQAWPVVMGKQACLQAVPLTRRGMPCQHVEMWRGLATTPNFVQDLCCSDFPQVLMVGEMDGRVLHIAARHLNTKHLCTGHVVRM